jgi:hypothetical protein
LAKIISISFFIWFNIKNKIKAYIIVPNNKLPNI